MFFYTNTEQTESEDGRTFRLWMRLVSARLQCSSAAAVKTPLVGLYPGKTLVPGARSHKDTNKKQPYGETLRLDHIFGVRFDYLQML